MAQRLFDHHIDEVAVAARGKLRGEPRVRGYHSFGEQLCNILELPRVCASSSVRGGR